VIRLPNSDCASLPSSLAELFVVSLSFGASRANCCCSSAEKPSLNLAHLYLVLLAVDWWLPSQPVITSTALDARAANFFALDSASSWLVVVDNQRLITFCHSLRP
jgi:hypothetical protein